MPGGVVPTDPDHALVFLADAIAAAEATQKWEGVRMALELVQDIVERTRLSFVGTDPPPE
jgi:hypothetical protein